MNHHPTLVGNPGEIFVLGERCRGRLIYLLYNYLRPKNEVSIMHTKGKPSEIAWSTRCFEFTITDDFNICIKKLYWNYTKKIMEVEIIQRFDVSDIIIDNKLDPILFYFIKTPDGLQDITWIMPHVYWKIKDK